MERKLAVILAADVVGYSALMERDEKGTYERLSARRKELFEPEIARHHGRIFKLMGDGMLAEFGSVIDAVECAVSLQRGLAERNAAIPEDQRVLVRIGINLGEVIVEGEDRYGEGVNIATRLEQLADPGGICVSGKVAKEVEKKLAFRFESMGDQKVKNIAEPVQAYRVRPDGAANAPPLPKHLPWQRLVAGLALALILAGLAGGTNYWFMRHTPVTETVSTVADNKPSLVVLPFANLSDDREQGYLADGITEDLTTELARIPGLFVISRNAAFTYKGKATAPSQVAKELGVRYILEGSTRRIADDLRINAQLIDSQSGGHLWAERFEGKWADVFALQDKVIANIAGTLELRLVSGEGKEGAAGGTNNPSAYDAYLKGLELSYRGTAEHTKSAIPYLLEALRLDPDFGRASAELAWLYWNADDKASQAVLGLSEAEINAKSDVYFADAAKHPSAIFYMLLAEHSISRHEHDAALAASERGIALDPSNPYIFEEMSWVLTLSGRPAEGLEYLEAVRRIDPRWNSGRYVMAALAYIGLGRFSEAAEALEKSNPSAEDSPYWSIFWLGYQRLRLLITVYGHLGRSADAARVKEQITSYIAGRGYDEFTVLLATKDYSFKNDADLERILDGLRKAGVPELPFGIDPNSKDRLTGPEIKTLLFGHELRGRALTSADAYSRTTTLDGTSRVMVGSEMVEGKTRIVGDVFCNLSGGGQSCSAIFRNRAGSAANNYQYLLVSQNARFEFSVVK